MSGPRGPAGTGRPDPSGPQRPRRPVLVELAAAVLVIGGIVSVLTSIQALAQLSAEGTPVDTLTGLSLAVGAGITVLGLFVRAGRGWLVGLNVVAVVAFLELTSGAFVGLVYGVLDLFVVLALVWERAWFYWSPSDDSEAM